MSNGTKRKAKKRCTESCSSRSKEPRTVIRTLHGGSAKKEVHVEQTDGVERQKVSDRIQAQKMSARAYGHHMAIVKEIQDEISEHDKSIDEEKKLADVHLANIKEYQQAIKALQEELKEEKEFIKAHEP